MGPEWQLRVVGYLLLPDRGVRDRAERIDLVVAGAREGGARNERGRCENCFFHSCVPPSLPTTKLAVLIGASHDRSMIFF